MTRITTTDFPQYFALVSRIKQEVHAVGPDGGVVSSSVVKEVTATFPAGALTKRIRVGIQVRKGESRRKIVVTNIRKGGRWVVAW